MVAFHCAHLRAQLRKQHALSDAPQDAATAVMQGFAQHIRNEKEVCRPDVPPAPAAWKFTDRGDLTFVTRP